MQPIKTIEDLIIEFDKATSSERVGVLKRIEIPKKEFEKFANWEKGKYKRNCIVRRDKFEFILLCWDIGASTPIHDHAGQDCWMYHVDGEICEKRYKESKIGFQVISEASYSSGKLTYMHDRMGFHNLENNSKNKTMTLHIYANPIDRCNVFNENSGTFEYKKMIYDNEPE